MRDFEKWRLSSPEEYRSGKRDPVNPTDMHQEVPYIWKVSLGRRAYAQQPARFEGLVPYDEDIGMYVVRFAVFDGSWHGADRSLDGEPGASNRQQAFFRSGLFRLGQDMDSSLYFQIPGGPQARVQEGYFLEEDEPSESAEPNDKPGDGAGIDITEVERFLSDQPALKEPASV